MCSNKYIILAGIIQIFIYNSCSSHQKKSKSKDNTPSAIVEDSTRLLSENMKKAYPYFDLQLDSSNIDTTKYINIIYPDTTHCSSFRLNRMFLGKLNSVKATVEEQKFIKKLFLQSGNLKLWLCNLPQQINAGDTLIITGYVYNILGNEKTWGYPTILTKIRL